MSRPQRILFYCPAIILVLFVCGMFTSRAATTQKDISPAVVAEDGRVALPLTPGERSWLTGHQTVRVAFDGYFPPYSFLSDTGRYKGLAVDIFKILADRTGITFVPFDKPLWKDLFAAAKRREVDVVATMGHRPEREQWFVFTRPYIFKSMMIMI
ncbi:MAG TPA: transporter substrate-binding domain-containing protein, partial [Desulfobulbus sp.]|nr:transporter substrate-binding domain-containing protein [Desulfobulbus sp.]